MLTGKWDWSDGLVLIGLVAMVGASYMSGGATGVLWLLGMACLFVGLAGAWASGRR